ncbi:hypothetical protein AT281_26690 [Bacillus cereus]|nr:hypothetical protein AT281_26690 [Bacillus cereus]
MIRPVIAVRTIMNKQVKHTSKIVKSSLGYSEVSIKPFLSMNHVLFMVITYSPNLLKKSNTNVCMIKNKAKKVIDKNLLLNDDFIGMSFVITMMK